MVVYLAGLARGIMDEHSDLDILVIHEPLDLRIVCDIQAFVVLVGWETGLEIDVESISYTSLADAEWDGVRRWDFSVASIAMDTSGMIRDLIKEKLRVDDRYWRWKGGDLLRLPQVVLPYAGGPTLIGRDMAVEG